MSYIVRFLDGTEREFETLRGADLYKVDLKEADLREACLIGANLEKADLREAYLREADLERADLIGANLRGADLKGAYLSGANLYKANLKEADLRRANLENTSVISGTLGKHFYFYHEGYLKIGCKGYDLEYWLNNYKSIGKQAEYSKRETHDYGCLIKFLYERERSLN